MTNKSIQAGIEKLVELKSHLTNSQYLVFYEVLNALLTCDEPAPSGYWVVSATKRMKAIEDRLETLSRRIGHCDIQKWGNHLEDLIKKQDDRITALEDRYYALIPKHYAERPAVENDWKFLHANYHVGKKVVDGCPFCKPLPSSELGDKISIDRRVAEEWLNGSKDRPMMDEIKKALSL
jgi:hypothetical protein